MRNRNGSALSNRFVDDDDELQGLSPAVAFQDADSDARELLARASIVTGWADASELRVEERRAYIIDDEMLLRRLVRQALAGTCSEIEEFDSAEAFLAGQDGRPAGCVIVDIRLPGIDGLDLLEIIAADRTGHAVVVISAHGSVPNAVRAGRLGVVDFIEKPFRIEQLRAAVHSAFEVLQMRRSSPLDPLETLTPREKQVLVSFATGGANKIVAHELGLSVRTVELHRANMMRKLGVRNLGQALLLAKDGGYV